MLKQSPGLPITVAFLVVLLIGVSITGLAALRMGRPTDTVAHGLHVGGADIGGLTREQAAQYIGPHLKRMVQEPILLGDAQRVIAIIPEEVGITIDEEATLDRAFGYDTARSPLIRVIRRMTASRNPQAIPPVILGDRELFEKKVSVLLEPWNHQAQDSVLHFLNNEVNISPSVPGQNVELQAIYSTFIERVASNRHRTVIVRTERTEPSITEKHFQDMNISRRISSFATKFDSTQQNRIQNIRISAQAIDNLLINPKESISFNSIVGPRLAEHGYKEAPVILDGKLVPDIGGGVCQVSSTFFNALILAGFDIVSRAPHSIPSTYVDLGRDAAVADGLIDLILVNPTDNHFLLSTSVTANQVEVEVFSNNSPYSFTVFTTIERIIPKPVEVKYDSTVEVGEELVVPGRNGYQVSLWREKRENGKIINTELLNRSTYQPQAEIVYRRP